jgi:hypothetical protein
MSRSSDRINKFRFLRDGDKIWVRLYSANDKYEDAVISPECLSLAVEDGAKIVRGYLQEQASKR